MTGLSAVSAVIRSYPQSTKQTADFRRSCFPPLGGNYCGSLRKGLRRHPQFRSSNPMEGKMKRRGWVEVNHNEPAECWDVFDWSEHHDSGARIGTVADKREATVAAFAWAAQAGRKCFLAVPQ